MSEDWFNEYMKNIDRIINNLNDLDSKEHTNMNDKNKNGKNTDGFMWFSLKPEDYEFPKSKKTTWNGEEQDAVSPDLLKFIISAGDLLNSAFFSPLKTGYGRLTLFFNWIDRARGRMEQQDFNDTGRQYFSAWCKEAALVILGMTEKNGLWLTDDEEGLVQQMAEGIFDTNEGGLA